MDPFAMVKAALDWPTCVSCGNLRTMNLPILHDIASLQSTLRHIVKGCAGSTKQGRENVTVGSQWSKRSTLQ